MKATNLKSRLRKWKEAGLKYWRNTPSFLKTLAYLLIALNAGWQLYTHVLSPQSASLPKDDPPKVNVPLPDKPTIAVLPFNNMSGDPGQESFVDGVTEDITTTLSKNPGLSVISRNMAFVYKGKPIDVKKAAENLGVRYVMEGSVRKSDGRIRIIAQLIDATSGIHIWSEKYDRDMKDLFALIDDVTRQIAVAVKMKLTYRQDWSEEQRELLKLEVEYWELYQARNLSAMLKLFHEESIIWPHWARKPIAKMELERAYKLRFKRQLITFYDLKPMAIKIFKEFAVIYARYNLMTTKGNTYTGRVGHVCIKQGGKWQIIGMYTGGSTFDEKNIPDVEQAWSEEQKELIKMEVQYYEARRTGNLSDYMKLFREDYISWPFSSSKPFGKVEMENLVKVSFKKPSSRWLKSQAVKPMAIKIIKDFAIIYYHINMVGLDNQLYGGRQGRVWIKQGGKWQAVANYSGGSTAN